METVQNKCNTLSFFSLTPPTLVPQDDIETAGVQVKQAIQDSVHELYRYLASALAPPKDSTNLGKGWCFPRIETG